MPELIEARTFRLTDDNGLKYGEWTAKDGFPALELYGKDGKVRVSVATSKVGTFLMVGRADEGQVAAFIYGDGSPSLTINKKSETLFRVPPEK